MQAINVIPCVPMTAGAIGTAAQFVDYVPYVEKPWVISGITLDSNSAPLGNCVVKLFNTSTDVLQQTSVSDGSGNYVFGVNNPTPTWYVVAYLAGSPDVAGVTKNTLVGA